MIEKLALWCARRRWVVVAVWAAAACSVFLVGEGTYSLDFDTPGDSSTAARIVEERFPEHAFPDSIDVVMHAESGVDSQAARVETMLARAADLPHVLDTVSPFELAEPPRVSADRTVALGSIRLDAAAFQVSDELVPAVMELRDQALAPGLRIELGGSAVLDYETDVGGSAEIIGFAAALVILAFVFGSLVATALPLLVALAGLAAGSAAIAVLSSVTAVPGFAPQISAMIGIGVGVDYALFVVTRYRQAVRSGMDIAAAVARAMGTSGRAVLVAGGTVVLALLGVVVIGQPDVAALGIAASTMVLLVMSAALTLLPALLTIVGGRIDRLSWRRGKNSGGRTRRWVRTVQRRPILMAAASTLLLLILCVPALFLRIGSTDAGDGPVGTTSRAAYDLVAEGFGPGRGTSILVVAETGPAPAERIAEVPGVAGVTPSVNPAGDTTVFEVYATTAPRDPATEQLVHRLRAELPDAYVGGVVAQNLDNAEQIAANLPVLLLAVLTCAFLLLMVGFRSLVVPLKAVLMNLLSIGAAYGAVVAVFQWGWGIGLFGLPGGAPIDSVLPVLMFAITFGLSMDYEVFLLSSVREEWLRTGDNSRAVAEGIGRTAGVVTAAAAIMVAVFAAFMMGSERQIQLFGFAFAVPILLDVLLIRMVLVPAAMELLGRANWYLPRWLDRAIPPRTDREL